MIEPHEVVHVGVRHEDVRDLQHVARIHAAEPAEVELHRATLPAQADEQSGVPEGPVHESWEECGLQGTLRVGPRIFIEGHDAVNSA